MVRAVEVPATEDNDGDLGCNAKGFMVEGGGVSSKGRIVMGGGESCWRKGVRCG